MALVARRVLQRLIRENAAFTTSAQRKRQVAALNRGGDQALNFEWELLVLNGLSKLAAIDHEPLLGTRHPDVVARVGDGAPEVFVADVATVSDSGHHARNPVGTFNAELYRRARQHIPGTFAFSLHVGGVKQGRSEKKHMVLSLPRKADRAAFFRAHVDPFLLTCRADPYMSQTLRLAHEGTDITIEYRPGARTGIRHHPVFTAPLSKTRNPIAGRLKNKAAQLRATQFAGPRGVVLCATDTDLRDGGRALGPRVIVEDVFLQNRSLTFVHALWAYDVTRRQQDYGSTLYVNPAAKHPLGVRSRSALTQLRSVLPRPINSGMNALHELRFWRWQRGRYFYGSWTMTNRTVRISVRVLMEYLAGRITCAEFVARHGGDQALATLFEQKLRRGQLLVGAEVQHVPDRDDDWIEFRFGPPDSATAPLRPE